MAIIEVQDLVVKYGDFTAVKGISFQVEEGEIFGFLGPNGAGKTTTINVLCTLLKPASGRAVLNGYDVTRYPAQVRGSIGLVFQDPSLDERLTALENLEFHGILYNVPTKLRRERATALLKLVELWDRKDSLVRTFSGGMKRRLELARGLLHYPKVLFLDEPTLGLDPQTRSHIWRYILELRQRERITIFFTTHYMDEANNCDRIAVIDYGQIVALDTPERLKSMVSGDIITLRTADDEAAIREIQSKYLIVVQNGSMGLRFEVPQGDTFIPGFITSLSVPILSISLSRPTLDDVFLKLTGHQIRDEEVGGTDEMRRHLRVRRMI